MRDRRSTTLSVSSTSSTDSSVSGSPCGSLQEKLPSSPPLSPTLPAPVTKENKSLPNARSKRSMAFKLLAALCTVFAIWHFLSTRPIIFCFDTAQAFPTRTDAIEESKFTNEPIVLAISDRRAHPKWTATIPHDHAFPLTGKQYRAMCKQSQVLRETISEQSRLVKAKDWRRKDSYYSFDRTFLEVEEAERTGLLPKSDQGTSKGDVCGKSLTFILSEEDASFGKSLLLLWLSYGLAMKEGRAFFVDDTRWAYGKYATYFAPPPPTNCVRPPPHQIVPCPHSANHIVVSSATSHWTFGASFEQEFLQARKIGIEKSRQIFDLLRVGYENLFHATGEDSLYSASRIAKFEDEAHQHAGSVVGIHLRRGDLHPLEYQFSSDYLPLERYAAAARKLLRSQLKASLPDSHTDADDFNAIVEYVHSPVLVASDDPEIVTSTDLAHAVSPFTVQKAQDRIQLATKAILDIASPAQDFIEPGSAYIKHVDENTGWEGGFYSALFFGLGKEKKHHSLSHNDTSGAPTLPSEQSLRLRELVGRAYLLDLAVLSRSDGVVCAVSSATCRLLGVMMGWDAVKDGRWVNVDDGRVWSWDDRR